MKKSDDQKRTVSQPEPRWAAILALLAFIGLYYALPEHLTLGPGWMVPILCIVLIGIAKIAYRTGNYRINEIFAYANLGVITLALVSSLALLIERLPAHKDPPIELLKAAAGLWMSNILVFASWYWRLDGGGPNKRELREYHTDGAFFFPQMAMDQSLKVQMGEDRWSPGFVDYLFLAFNTNTAFSPTDVPVLSRWAKAMMMVQSSISLVTVALLAARAVNVL